MRIFNENKTQEIQDYNEELYYLKDDKLFIKHHEAVEEIKQVSHLEIVRRNEKTGGVEYQEIIDVPYQPAKEAYDEYEDIQVIVPYTEKDYEQLIVSKIREQYTINQELAILRQRDTKPEEFAQYNTYVEQCKIKVKEIVYGNRL